MIGHDMKDMLYDRIRCRICDERVQYDMVLLMSYD